MMAEAFFMIGTQSGSVVEVTRIEPSMKRSMSRAFSIRQTRPVEIALPTESPVTSVLPLLPIV